MEKKVVFNSVREAQQVFDTLRAFGPSMHLPRAIGCQGRAVRTEFVEGSPVDPDKPAHVDALSRFYAQLYARAPRQAAVTETGLIPRFEANIDTLEQLGVLATGLSAKLRSRVQAVAPRQVWLGFEYSDPITNNLVYRDDCNCICAIDIKNIRANELLGKGLAKARHRWLTDTHVSAFFDKLRAQGAPDIEADFVFVRRIDEIERLAHKLQGESELWFSRRLRKLQRDKLRLEHFA